MTAFVAVVPGPATLPDISIDWFNLQTNQVETAQLLGLSFEVTGRPL